MDTRFGSWAFTWPPTLPSDIEQKAIPFLKPYLTYRWVTRDAPSTHHSIADAWEELAHLAADSTIQMGLQWRSNQKKNSEGPRKHHYISFLRLTMAQLVNEFSQMNLDTTLSYAEAWPRFYAYLESKDVDPREVDEGYQYSASFDDRVLFKFVTFKRYMLNARKAARKEPRSGGSPMRRAPDLHRPRHETKLKHSAKVRRSGDRTQSPTAFAPKW